MCGGHTIETKQRARKEHSCAACNIPIPIGRDYIKSIDLMDGTASTTKWHSECWERFGYQLSEAGEDCGNPTETWEDYNPIEIQVKYLHGPWPEGTLA